MRGAAGRAIGGAIAYPMGEPERAAAEMRAQRAARPGCGRDG